MKLIVGLGNPGKEYENTRHNVGFMVVDNYTKGETFQSKFNGLYIKKVINGENVIILKPQSYMNLSGDVVVEFVNFFKIDTEDILIIRDDLDIEVGKAKIKFDSSSGGDNGIKSIINRLNTQAFTQFKIGIGNNKLYDTKDYVLGRFSKEELELLNNIIDKSSKIIDDFITCGKDEIMSKYNGVLK